MTVKKYLKPNLVWKINQTCSTRFFLILARPQTLFVNWIELYHMFTAIINNHLHSSQVTTCKEMTQDDSEYFLRKFHCWCKESKAFRITLSYANCLVHWRHFLSNQPAWNTPASSDCRQDIWKSVKIIQEPICLEVLAILPPYSSKTFI